MLEARQRVRATEHLDTLTSISNLALILRALDDVPGAQALEDELARLRARQRR